MPEVKTEFCLQLLGVSAKGISLSCSPTSSVFCLLLVSSSCLYSGEAGRHCLRGTPIMTPLRAWLVRPLCWLSSGLPCCLPALLLFVTWLLSQYSSVHSHWRQLSIAFLLHLFSLLTAHLHCVSSTSLSLYLSLLFPFSRLLTTVLSLW